MRLPRRERRGSAQPNLTSLIDVLFILIIFFTVSSTWKEQPALELDLPSAGTARLEPVSEVVVTVDAEGVVYVGESEVEESALAERLSVALGEGDDPPPVVISADERAPHGTVVRVLDAARAQGARRVLISAKSDGGGEE